MTEPMTTLPLDDHTEEIAPPISESAASNDRSSEPHAEINLPESRAELLSEVVADDVPPDEVSIETAELTVESEADERDEADADVVDEMPEAEPEPVEPAPPENLKKWYIVKVQSNREETIKVAIERQVKIRGLEPYFGRIVIPVERSTEMRKMKVKDKKTGETTLTEKRVTVRRKKFPGYLMAEVEFNEHIQYLFRETSGVGDFVRSGPNKPPQPMPDIEVQRMLASAQEEPDDKSKVREVKLKVRAGDRVRICEGMFKDQEGVVLEIIEPKDAREVHKVKVEAIIWNRPVSVELDHWHVEPI